MYGKEIKRSFLPIPVIIIFAFVTFAYYDVTHEQAAAATISLIEEIDSLRNFPLYDEIYGENLYKERLIKGAVDEDYGVVDGNERSFRHYYDPATGEGCPWYSYFYAWRRQGAVVSKPAKGYYEGAKEWGRNGGRSGTLRNWEGAIKAYDYAESSRAEAYWRLGHVVHLIADMAQPDHATNTPHAVSGYTYPDDLDLLLGFLPESNSTTKAIRDNLNLALSLYSLTEIKRDGFELLIEKLAKEGRLHIRGEKIHKRMDFSHHFNMVAEKSKETIAERFFTLPLGITYYPGKIQSEYMRNWSFFPDIYENDMLERAKFEGLAEYLLSYSTQYSAGIIELFFDIVNPPPYVRSVTLSQGGLKKYHAFWQDFRQVETGIHDNEGLNEKYRYSYETVLERDLIEEINIPILPEREARIMIEFGAGPAIPVSEHISSVVVNLGEEYIPGQLSGDRSTWEGRFVPRLPEGVDSWKYMIEIRAKDIHNHFPNRSALGELAMGRKEYDLDSDPRFPAKASCREPYHWTNYFPGSDMWHAIVVQNEKATDERRKKEAPQADPIVGQWKRQGDGTIIEFKWTKGKEYQAYIIDPGKTKIWGFHKGEHCTTVIKTGPDVYEGIVKYRYTRPKERIEWKNAILTVRGNQMSGEGVWIRIQ